MLRELSMRQFFIAISLIFLRMDWKQYFWLELSMDEPSNNIRVASLKSKLFIISKILIFLYNDFKTFLAGKNLIRPDQANINFATWARLVLREMVEKVPIAYADATTPTTPRFPDAVHGTPTPFFDDSTTSRSHYENITSPEPRYVVVGSTKPSSRREFLPLGVSPPRKNGDLFFPCKRKVLLPHRLALN